MISVKGLNVIKSKGLLSRRESTKLDSYRSRNSEISILNTEIDEVLQKIDRNKEKRNRNIQMIPQSIIKFSNQTSPQKIPVKAPNQIL